MTVKTYDAKNVSVSVGGISITGFADGTFVECAAASERHSTVVGAQGEVSVATTNDGRGTIKITLKQTSASIPYLTGVAKSKTPVAIHVAGVGETISGSQSLCKKLPDIGYGKDIGNRVYEFEVFDYTVN
jgi:hypothetical protein